MVCKMYVMDTHGEQCLQSNVIAMIFIIRKTNTAFLVCLIRTQQGIMYATFFSLKHYKIGKRLIEI